MLSARERKIAIITAVLVAALVLYQYIFLPLYHARNALALKQQQLQGQLDNDQRLLALARRATHQWILFHQAGLGPDASKAESTLLNNIRQWSQQANLALTAIRPDRASSQKNLHALTLQVSATGSMQAITDFLYRAQTAQHPLHIGELQIAAPPQNHTGQLSLQLRISSLWQTPPAPGNANQPDNHTLASAEASS